MSHVNACPIASVKTSLLQSLQTTVNESKYQALAPTFEHLSKSVTATTETLDKDTESLFVSATATIDSTAVPELNNVSKSTWPIFETFLRICLQNRKDNYMSALSQFADVMSVGNLKFAREAMVRNAHQLIHGRLSTERREQLCKLLLDVAGEPDAPVRSTSLRMD